MTTEAIRSLLLRDVPSDTLNDVLDDSGALRPVTSIGVLGVLKAHEVEGYLAEGVSLQDLAEAVMRYLV